MTRSTQNFTKQYVFLCFLLLILFAFDLLLGSVHISFDQFIGSLFNRENYFSTIIWHFRMPKAITCVLAGGALATSGLLMQTLFRNPLAGPDVLGLSSGASLMVAILIFLGGSISVSFAILAENPWSIAIAASLGGGLIFMLIISVAHYLKDNVSLLIVGLMISAITASLVSILQFISKAEDLQTFIIWSLGNVGGTNWNEVLALSILFFLGILIVFFLVKSLNTWLLGENYATSLGINLSRSRFWIVISTGILTGGVTAFCGPITFVGLAVPHLVRLAIPTTNHKILLPGVIIGGACLLLLCDLLSQLPGSTQVLPLNAVTSLIGAPVVIWLLIKSKRIHV
jgi:iron complex transport system permease protein